MRLTEEWRAWNIEQMRNNRPPEPFFSKWLDMYNLKREEEHERITENKIEEGREEAV